MAQATVNTKPVVDSITLTLTLDEAVAVRDVLAGATARNTYAPYAELTTATCHAGSINAGDSSNG